jgi:hypothetical protein
MHSRHIAPFLAEALADTPVVVLCTGREIIPYGDELYAVPMSVWWSAR